jgi:hypothetical protein
MQFLPFHNLVASFLNRKDITDTQIDFFINTALREFQLRQNLQVTRKMVLATYPSTAGVGVALDGTSGVDGQFRALVGDYAVSFMDPNGVAVPILGDTFANVQRRIRWNNPPNSLEWPAVNISVLPISQQTIVYYTQILSGVQTLFTFPEIASVPLGIFYYSWIVEYDYSGAPAREDWLLKYGNQVLLWGALQVANRFLAEDARIVLDTNEYEKAIDTVLRMDSVLPLEGASLNLD